MRVILRAVALVVLAGCAAEPEVELPSYRDRTVPIASQVDVEEDVFTGHWTVRATTRVLPLGAKLFARSYPDGHYSLIQLSPHPLDDEVVTGAYSAYVDGLRFAALGAGRYVLLNEVDQITLAGPLHDLVLSGGGNRQLWILWADADRRTLAIGTPDGSFGFILDRNDTGGDDRIAAARDIMAWMGYRIEEMVTR